MKARCLDQDKKPVDAQEQTKILAEKKPLEDQNKSELTKTDSIDKSRIPIFIEEDKTVLQLPSSYLKLKDESPKKLDQSSEFIPSDIVLIPEEETSESIEKEDQPIADSPERIFKSAGEPEIKEEDVNKLNEESAEPPREEELPLYEENDKEIGNF